MFPDDNGTKGKDQHAAGIFSGVLHLLLLREINPPEAWEPTWAQGIEAEIPEELRSNSEELERKARFLRAGHAKMRYKN
ncbi:MAG: hypothetical protein LBG10_09160 [Treponema sp.]|jgi:hypothetical protein|nr:hypothetical protein [Treponema sp.]